MQWVPNGSTSDKPSCVQRLFCCAWLLLQAIGAAAWTNIHGLSYHTYQQSFSAVQAELTSLHNTYGKPIWITEVAAGNSASVAQNQQLMVQLVQWAAGQSWIERVFWNQAVSILRGPGVSPVCLNKMSVGRIDSHKSLCQCFLWAAYSAPFD